MGLLKPISPSVPPPHGRGGFRRGIFFVFIFLSCSASLHAQVLKTLSGRVSRTDPSAGILYVNFTNPATEAVREMPFHITLHTGLHDIRRLAEVKPEDIVTVDYEESPSGELQAVYVAKFRISGPPTGFKAAVWPFKGESVK